MVLVNNAGISGVNKPTHEITEEEWDKLMNINVKGVFFCTKHVINSCILKNVEIAVSNAIDAARSAAALVMTQPGLGVITNAVEESRRIFERMSGYATFRITESLRLLMFMTISIIMKILNKKTYKIKQWQV